jgi:putative sterol carrier protein
MDLFSPAGISAWQSRLNQSPAFADAAKSWSGRLLLIETDDAGAARSTWVVVDAGRCTEARTGDARDDAAADFVLAAAPTIWSDLVAARTTPATAALKGQLTLQKGDAMSLIPHARAAAELLAAAAGEAT